MSDDDLIADDDEFLDSLVDEALADDSEGPAARFAHAFVDAGVLDVLRAIRNGIQDEPRSECRFFGTTTNLLECCVYLAAKEGGTILWLPQKALNVVAVISHRLDRTVHWLSVYEITTCRAYLRFDNGRCTKEVLDPTRYWTENILEGDDVVGKGQRAFGSYESFLETLSSTYVPKDTEYDFERIDEAVADGIGPGDRIGPMVKACVTNGLVAVDFVGNWPQHERRAIEASLAED